MNYLTEAQKRKAMADGLASFQTAFRQLLDDLDTDLADEARVTYSLTIRDTEVGEGQCPAVHPTHDRRCGLPAGHKSDHSLVYRWADANIPTVGVVGVLLTFQRSQYRYLAWSHQ